MHYAQIHQLEAAAIEEIQLRERRQFEDQQEHIIELDLKGILSFAKNRIIKIK